MKEAIVNGIICGLILGKGIAIAILLHMGASFMLFLVGVGIRWIKDKGNKK